MLLGSAERGKCHGECGMLGHGFHHARSDAVWADEHWRAHPHDGIAVRPFYRQPLVNGASCNSFSSLGQVAKGSQIDGANEAATAFGTP